MEPPTIATTNSTVEDSLIELNPGASSNSNDLGFIFERGSTGNNAQLFGMRVKINL